MAGPLVYPRARAAGLRAATDLLPKRRADFEAAGSPAGTRRDGAGRRTATVNSMRLLFFAATLAVLLGSTLRAQVPAGPRVPSLTGQVLDQRGGAIRSAKVMVRN